MHILLSTRLGYTTSDDIRYHIPRLENSKDQLRDLADTRYLSHQLVSMTSSWTYRIDISLSQCPHSN
jgi:hypothetical protein